MPVQVQQVEREEEQGVVALVAQRRLQSVEARDAVRLQRHQLSVEQQIAMAEGGNRGGDGGQARRPVEPVAGGELHGTGLAAGKQTVAV